MGGKQVRTCPCDLISFEAGYVVPSITNDNLAGKPTCGGTSGASIDGKYLPMHCGLYSLRNLDPVLGTYSTIVSRITMHLAVFLDDHCNHFLTDKE